MRSSARGEDGESSKGGSSEEDVMGLSATMRQRARSCLGKIFFRLRVIEVRQWSKGNPELHLVMNWRMQALSAAHGKEVVRSPRWK